MNLISIDSHHVCQFWYGKTKKFPTVTTSKSFRKSASSLFQKAHTFTIKKGYDTESQKYKEIQVQIQKCRIPSGSLNISMNLFCIDSPHVCQFFGEKEKKFPDFVSQISFQISPPSSHQKIHLILNQNEHKKRRDYLASWLDKTNPSLEVYAEIVISLKYVHVQGTSIQKR